MEIERQLTYNSLQAMDVVELERLIGGSPWFSFARQVLLEKLSLYGDEVFQTQLSANAIFLTSRAALYKKVQERLHKSTVVEQVTEVAPAVETAAPQVEVTAPQAEVTTSQAEIAIPQAATAEAVAATESFEQEKEQLQMEWERLQQEREKLKKEREEFERQRDGTERVVVAGGDFFSREDLKSLSPDEDMEVQLKSTSLSTLAPRHSEHKKAEIRKSSTIDYSSVIGPDGKVNFNDLAFYTETLGHIYAQQGLFEQAIDVFSKLILLYPQKSAYFAALVKDLKKKSTE
ncbi:MAG: hypothetical protein IKI67_08445 [Bacteroidales bacterium]|nr:hypothetical protein [Bacteroidales bacterium]